MAVEPVDPDGPIESRKFFCHAFLRLREGTRKNALGGDIERCDEVV